MAGIVVTYRTQTDQGDVNQRLVEAVFDELARTRPHGLRYASFRLGDGVTFVHLALVDDPSANPLVDSDAFAAFQRGLASRCDAAPSPSQAQLIGSYRVFETDASGHTTGGQHGDDI